MNQKGQERSPNTKPHLFFLATKIIALTPKIDIPICAMASKENINF